MLKKYKNEFFDIICRHGLDPASFRLNEGRTYTLESVVEIGYLNSGLFFKVFEHKRSINKFQVCYTCFEKHWPLQVPDRLPWYHSIKYVYKRFNEWLTNHVEKYISEELQQWDLWKQIESGQQFFTGGRLSSQETSPFTEDEQQQLQASITQFRLLICKNFDPTQEQLEVVDELLSYLREAAKRLNRFDWKSLGLSTVINIVVALTLDTNKGRLLFVLFKQAFSGLLYLLGVG